MGGGGGGVNILSDTRGETSQSSPGSRYTLARVEKIEFILELACRRQQLVSGDRNGGRLGEMERDLSSGLIGLGHRHESRLQLRGAHGASLQPGRLMK